MVLSAACAAQAAEKPNGAHTLTVGEGFVNPVGFHDPTPFFSWKLPVGVRKQTAYHLEVSDHAAIWDSGWVESDQSVFVPYDGETLRSRQQLKWRVRYRDENGKDHGWSEYARFELGLLSSRDWKAQWIRPTAEPGDGEEPVALLRREFPVKSKVKKARLYVTARGVFEVSLNGVKVGRDYFANGWTSYTKRIDTLTYDITDQLRPGSNTISAFLGMGWYAGALGFKKGEKNAYGTIPELLCQLEVTYEDGVVETVVSNSDWQGSWDGPLISSSIYHGETYDARQQVQKWGTVVSNPELGAARLIPKPFAPVRKTERLSTRSINEPTPGRFVFDLGQNMVGWARLKIPVEKGRTITIRFAEMLNRDGTLYTVNYRTAKSTDYYTAAEAGTIEWEPRFTFHGFRYVELSGLPETAVPKKEWVSGVVLHSDLPKLGQFSSSHEKLNQLQSNITWGQRGNFLDIPTDCPQRNERLGWTGDAQVFASTSMFNYDCHAFWKSWLGSMRDDQLKDGRVPHIVPNMMNCISSSGWMDAATIIPWAIYVRTGDIEVLADNFDMMKKLLAWYHTQSGDGLSNKNRGFGDWLQPYSQNKNNNKGDTPQPFIEMAFRIHSTDLVAKVAGVLGRNAESSQYAKESAQLGKVFARHYFDADGKLQNVPETQTGYLLAIAFDLLPEESKKRATEHLVRLVHEADGHLRTGFLGTPFIVPMLDEKGYSDLALSILFKETYPSWFFSINQGATTMWERWNSYSHKDGFGKASMNSFNHYAYGAIGQWMYERLAGLAPDPANPGYKHFFVRPLIASQLDHAHAELETPYGKASSGWKRKNGKIIMDVVVPPNTSATIEFPNGQKSVTVDSGNHHFELEL